MPHIARTRGDSGYYHVVPKGIADQLVFEDDIDRRYYLKLLSEAKRACPLISLAHVGNNLLHEK